MTDYLELLLERWQEDEENRESLALGPEEGTFHGEKSPKKFGEDPEPSVGGRTRTEQGAVDPMAPAGAGAPALRSATPRPIGPGDVGRPRRSGTAGALLEQRLQLVRDALAGGAEGPAPAVSERSAPMPVRRTDLTAGAEGLSRRLAQVSLASAAAPARVVFDGGPGADPAAADWEAFDRLLERDARRYDGGLGPY